MAMSVNVFFFEESIRCFIKGVVELTLSLVSSFFVSQIDVNDRSFGLEDDTFL